MKNFIFCAVSARVSIGLSEIVRMNKTDFIINAYKKCQLSFEIFEHFETEFLKLSICISECIKNSHFMVRVTTSNETFYRTGKNSSFLQYFVLFLGRSPLFFFFLFVLQSLSYLQKTLESFITKTWARKRLRGLKLGKLESWIYIIKKTLYITFNPLTHKVQNFLERMFCNHFFAAKIEEYSIVD